MRHLKPASLASLAVLMTPALVLAHPGHDTGSFTAGVAHPFSGLDHTLAMLAVGIWAMHLGGRSRWLVPLSFLVTMSVGGALAMAHVHLPLVAGGVEGGILLSVLIMGLILLFALRLPAGVGAALAAVFALFHGFAHGAEMPANGAALSYALGFIIATAMLLLIGEGLGAAAVNMRRVSWIRACGGGIVAAALLLATGVI